MGRNKMAMKTHPCQYRKEPAGMKRRAATKMTAMRLRRVSRVARLRGVDIGPGTGRYSRLRNGFLAFLCQRVEVATARVQHTCAHQLINGIEDLQPFFRLVAPCLEEHMQIQVILPECSE